jgi:hypothetical protein
MTEISESKTGTPRRLSDSEMKDIEPRHALTKVKSFTPPYHDKIGTEHNFLESIQPSLVDKNDLLSRMNPYQREKLQKFLNKEISPEDFEKMNKPIIEEKNVYIDKDGDDTKDV